MALTTAEQHDIIFFLGWPLKTLIQGSTHYETIVVNRLANLDSDIETRTRSLLAQLHLVDKALADARCRFSADQVDDIKLNREEANQLAKERRRYQKQLSQALDIPITGGDSVNVGVMA